jgi:spermidine synthase
MMEEQNPNRPTAVSRRFLPVLLPLFVASGCAALIYEIVWFQLLQLVIGSSAVSLAVLLGTFMGGMCLGSVALPRFVSARRHPLRVYALLELSIGLLGVVVLFAMPLVSRLYVAGAGQGMMGIFLRGIVCAVCLLPPTVLMGATLPALARWIETTREGVSWLGYFYGANIAGAVFGCLLAGFYLLRVHDMATATWVAAMLNAAVALSGLGLAVLSGNRLAQSHSSVGPQASTTRGMPALRVSWPVYLTIALSGMCALGAEVIWTRLLSLMLGGTVYTFSIILAVFLVGLGLGSAAGSFLSRGQVRPRIALGVCQMLLVAAIAWSAYMIAEWMPFWPINPALSRSTWSTFQIDLVRCVWAILPAAILWGASFPLALAAVSAREHDAARLVGKVYAANTLGAIVGALGASLVLVAWIGTQHAQQVLMALCVVSALFMLARLGRGESAKHGLPDFAVASMIALAVVFIWNVPKVPWGLIAYGRYFITRIGETDLLYAGEGMNSSVAVTESTPGARNFHVSGKIEASTVQQDMRLQRMLGHIPGLLHPNPRSVLVVGCGAGVTAGSFVKYPSIKRIVICEIEPLIPQVVAQYFGAENYNVVKDPRVKIVFDDARHYVLTTKEKFDIITSDPIHPYVKGAATLYTKEYFEMVRRHLNPGGLVTQWVPLYESDAATVKSEVATFFNVFPEGTVWGNDQIGAGYDLVLLGQADPMQIDLDVVQQRWQRDHAVAESLDDVGIKSPLGLLANFAGLASDLAPWLKDAEINRDRNLRLQYLAGSSSHLRRQESIYDEMMDYRKLPEGLFVGSLLRRYELQKAILGTSPDQ